MPTDWSGVQTNVLGCPMGFIRVTASNPPGNPLLIDAAKIASVEEVGPTTAITYGISRLLVKENIREVFRMRAESNTVESVSPPSPAIAGTLPEQRDRVRKKA